MSTSLRLVLSLARAMASIWHYRHGAIAATVVAIEEIS
jgi:hypothetical protein